MAGRSNKLRNEPKSAETKGTKKSAKKTGFVNPFKKMSGNRRFQQILGLSFVIFSIFACIAFVSYLFTWRGDQDLLLGPATDYLGDRETLARNWAGKIGALVSHYFIYNWFGLGAFLLLPIFFLSGIRMLFNVNIVPLRKNIIRFFFGTLFVSALLGFLFYEKNRMFGGAFGFQVNAWLSSLAGRTGAGMFLFFSAAVYLIIAGILSPDKFAALFNRPEKSPETEEENEISGNRLVRESESESGSEESESEDDEFNPDELEIVYKPSEPEVPTVPEIKIEDIPEEEEDLELEETTPVNENDPTILSESNGLKFELEKATEEGAELTPEEIEKKLAELDDFDPTLELSSYKFPTVDLLEKYSTGGIQINKEELEANKNKILDTLRNYNIDIEKIKATIGPTVTLYEIVPAAGVRISRIKNLEDDIALSLSALGIRIIAPIPGRGTIGIEVPNQHPEMVPMRTLIASDKFQNTDMELPIALGKTISNETYIADLAKMPHLLMAGATGQGKSVGLNAILVSLLYKKHPSQIKFVLVDPKKVELTLFNKIERHFLAKLPDSEDAIITDNKKVINTLNSLCIEMDNRYELLKTAMVRNLKEYNTKFIARRLNPNDGHRYLPYIVLVVDEFADLIMTAGKEVETPIARLAQLARAIGIHLIIATQRPSVNIITGTIKANFPARIAFRVTSKIDSRTILDTGGADQLIGRGDMLLSTGNDLIRLQCAFVDTPEVERITGFIGDQRGFPEAHLLPEFKGDEEGSGSAGFDASDKDALFEEAARIIVQHQQGSASLLQRRLKLGYNRAGRLIDQLESAGIIGPFEGSKARQVLVTDEVSLEQFLKDL